MIDFKKLIQAGVHFGHPRTRWCPKMKPYIWGLRNDIHLIDVSKTAQQAERAAQFLQATAAEGKTILWVGTKKSARDIIQKVAQDLNMPYVNHRWIGGTLSNYEQVKKSITKLLHYEDILAKTDKATSLYTKKEFNVFQKIVERLSKSVGGIRGLKWPIGAIVVVDVRKERSVLKEAAAMRIPVVALVDTDGDPSWVDYVIPGNDDSPRAISIVMEDLAQAAGKGKEVADKAQDEAKKNAKAVASEASVSHKDDKRFLDEDLEDGETTSTVGKGPRKPTAQRRAPSVGGGRSQAGGRPQHKGRPNRPSGETSKKSD